MNGFGGALISRVAAAALVASSSAAAAQAPQQPPQWGLSYDNKQCSLWRTDGRGNTYQRVGIRPSLTGESTRIFVVYRGTTAPTRWSKGVLTYGNTEVPIDFIDFPAADLGKRFIKFDLPTDRATTVLRSPSLKLRGEGVRELQFSLDGLALHSPKLDRCVAQLVNRLGLDEARRSSVARPAQFDAAEYFTPGDYPVVAARLGISGATRVTVVVGADGSVVQCSVTEGSGNAVLDHVTCETFEKEVKFTPTIDSAGRAVASVYKTRISWRVE